MTAPGNDGHHAGGGRKADALHFEIPHDALGDVESERAAAGEEDGVNALDEGAGAEQVCLTRAGGCAAHLDAANRAVFRE